MNPFRSVDALFGRLLTSLERLPKAEDVTSKLTYLTSLEQSSAFNNVMDSLSLGVAMILRGLYGMLSGMLLQTADGVEVLQNILGGANSDAFETMKNILAEKRQENPYFTMGDLILDMKKDNVDATLKSCDFYLRLKNEDPKSFGIDSLEGKIATYIGTSNDYELMHCDVDPDLDAQSPFFKYGTASNSWLMAPLASLLHYAIITKQAADLQPILSKFKIEANFVPKAKSDGMVTKSLFPTGSADGKKSYLIDSRLPIAKTKVLRSSAVTNLPQNLIDFARGKILSPVLDQFANKYSWALVENTVACKLNVSADTRESIGTGMLILSGKTHGSCYGNVGANAWRKRVVRENTRHGNDYDTVIVSDTKSSFTEEQLLNLMKSLALSMSDTTELLESSPNNPDILKKLSMFMVRKKDNGVAYAILYTDDTPEVNLIYANDINTNIQPLMNLSNVDEVWKYPVTWSDDDNELLENVEMTKIIIGSSTSNTKLVELPCSRKFNWTVFPDPLNKQNREWTDKFSVQVSRNRFLKVTRMDKQLDWGQRLELGAKRTVAVGPSSSNKKVAELPSFENISWLCSSKPFHKQADGWKDKFSTTIEGNMLTISRLDSNKGWGQDLVLEAASTNPIIPKGVQVTNIPAGKLTFLSKDDTVLPAKIGFDAVLEGEDDYILSWFSSNKKPWGDKDCDALTWSISIKRDDQTFRFRGYNLSAAGYKVTHVAKIRAVVGKVHRIECVITPTSAEYSVDGNVCARATFPAYSLNPKGHFGIDSGWNKKHLTIANLDIDGKISRRYVCEATANILNF